MRLAQTCRYFAIRRSEAELAHIVTEKANGVFLYARCVMDDLATSDGTGGHQVPATLKGLRELSLPNGMGGSDGVYFRRFAGEPDPDGAGRIGGEYPADQVKTAYQCYCLPMFEMLGAAAGPVPDELLQVALDLKLGFLATDADGEWVRGWLEDEGLGAYADTFVEEEYVTESDLARVFAVESIAAAAVVPRTAVPPPTIVPPRCRSGHQQHSRQICRLSLKHAQ